MANKISDTELATTEKFYCSNTDFGGKSCSKQCRSCREIEQEPEEEDFSYDVE